MAECWDCYYSEPDYHSDKYVCKKKRKKLEGDAVACSSFVSEDAPSCLDCVYAEADTHIYAKIGTYKCTKRKRKVKADDLACSQFVRE